MKLFSLIFQFNTFNQDYSRVHGLIREYDHIRINETGYFVWTKLSAKQIYDELRPFLNTDDLLLVTGIKTPWHGHARSEIIDWLSGKIQ